MKKIAVLLFLCSTTIFAQDRFVEVVVSDTIKLKPVAYNYQLALGPQNIFGFDMDDREKDPEEEKKKRMAIETFLEVGDYVYQVSPLSTMASMLNTEVSVSYVVTVEVGQQNNDFVRESDQLEGVSVIKKNTIWSNEQAEQQRLYEKLMAAAKERAAYLAGLGNAELGELLGISEAKGQKDSFDQWMDKLGGMNLSDVYYFFQRGWLSGKVTDSKVQTQVI